MKSHLIKSLIKIGMLAGVIGFSAVNLNQSTYAAEQSVEKDNLSEEEKINRNFWDNVDYFFNGGDANIFAFGFIPKENNKFLDNINKLRVEIYQSNGKRENKPPILVKNIDSKTKNGYFFTTINKTTDPDIFKLNEFKPKNLKSGEKELGKWFDIYIFDNEKNTYLADTTVCWHTWETWEQLINDFQNGTLVNSEGKTVDSHVFLTEKNHLVTIFPDNNKEHNKVDCSEIIRAIYAPSNLHDKKNVKLRWLENGKKVFEKDINLSQKKIRENNIDVFEYNVDNELNSKVLKTKVPYLVEVCDSNGNFLCKFNHTIKD